MNFRISTQSSYARVLAGLRGNQFLFARSQEQIASGLRILRPSDDPTGAAKALSLTRQIADVVRHGSASDLGRTRLEAATAGLQDGSSVLGEARALLIEAMNGTLSQEDRDLMANQFDLLRDQLLDVGNLKSDGRFLFGGTESDAAPWQEVNAGGRTRAVYRGNDAQQLVRVGEGVDVPLNLPGSLVFQQRGPRGLGFTDLTGVAAGTTANQGSGWTELLFRHDATTPGALASVGLALANGGADDTLLGANGLVVDVAAGTVRLGTGPEREIPGSGSADLANFVVANEHGGELHLDFTGFTGAGYTGTVTGQGSVSLDGTDFVPLSFTETDLELRDDALGIVLHVDTTGVRRAGSELVSFDGTVNVFDALAGIAEDLRNGQGLEHAELLQRLNVRLDQLADGQTSLLGAMGTLGARSQSLTISGQRADDVELQLQGLRSNIVDVDIAAAALDLTRAELTLQTAQASGARLIQTTLLNFLG